MKFFSLFLALLAFQNAHADWQTDTLAGVQLFYYVPKATTTLSTKTSKKALMVSLHGCAQKADDLKKDGNWENTADDYNMIVALPKVPNGGVYSGCWDYYGADHTRTNRHNDAVIKLVQAMLAKPELNIDPAQVYVSGLSSGGGESMVLGCLAPDIFAGMGLNAGPSTGSTANEISYPRTSLDSMLSTCKKLGADHAEFFNTQLTSIIYGNNDYIVNTAFDTNNAEIMRTIYGANTKSTFDTKKLEGSSTDGTGTMWSDDKGPRVSLIMNTGLGHNWPAGSGGNGGTFINKKSINYPDYLAKFFFTNNRRTKSVVLPEVMINPIQTKDSMFIVSGTVTIPKESVKAIEVVVKNKTTSELVDRFPAILDNNNHFTAVSKNLSNGAYNFDVEVKTPTGVSRIFKRDSWLGEVEGINRPQLVSSHYQSVEGCLVMNGIAVNNGEDKITSVQAIIDDTQKFETTVQNTFWSFNLCDFKTGEHTVVVYAENESGLASNVEKFTFESSLNSATATVQEHMEAKRLKWEDYGYWYQKYGNNRFTLYLSDTRVWGEKVKK